MINGHNRYAEHEENFRGSHMVEKTKGKKEKMETQKIAVFVGRMCPIHVGHQSTIDQMIKDVGEENSLIILGSVGQKITFRVLFTYFQRKEWIRKIYNYNIRIVGVPDFPNDDISWKEMVFDQIYSAFGHLNDKFEIVFYGGSIKDVEIFHDVGARTKIVDRTKVPVSATVIRDLMLRGVDVTDFLHEKIHGDVVKKFAKIMEESEKWETPF